MVILLNNTHGELSANTAFAFLASSNDGNCFWHGFKEKKAGRLERPLLNQAASEAQRFTQCIMSSLVLLNKRLVASMVRPIII